MKDPVLPGENSTGHSRNEQLIPQLALEKAIVQGKFEIAANILHDIGNAVVGFGSYLSRIKRSMEQIDPGNLQKLYNFLSLQQNAMKTAIGEAKAEALVQMLAGITTAQKNFHEEIQRSITEQLHILNHIQDILNIQRQYLSGNEVQEKSTIDLRCIVNDCMSMLFASIEKRKIIVSLNIPIGLPFITGSRTKLMQVILNVVKNSMEAIDLQGEEKNISMEAAHNENLLVLSIRDSGQGFNTETAKKLFTRGFTTKTSGTGLGLDHCRSIIEGHDGAITITSEGIGKGAITTIAFPVEPRK